MSEACITVPNESLEALQREGFTILPTILSTEECQHLIPEFDRTLVGKNGGIHNGLEFELGRTLAAKLMPIGRSIEGTSAVAIRALFFDKLPGRNWALPLHQDTAIPVDAHQMVPGFSAQSIKDGIAHVVAPSAILSRVIAVRLHLDVCNDDNGPLIAVPGTHANGILDDATIQSLKSSSKSRTLIVGAGDVVLMRPLTLHGSQRSTSTSHRRVVHVEYAPACLLPEPLRWPEYTY